MRAKPLRQIRPEEIESLRRDAQQMRAVVLQRLGRFAPQELRVVELRFFAGLSVEGTAEVLGVSPRTVARDWRIAKAWLRREIEGAAADET